MPNTDKHSTIDNGMNFRLEDRQNIAVASSAYAALDNLLVSCEVIFQFSNMMI